MDYLYYCPKCHYFGIAPHDDPNDYQACSECHSAMIYAGYTKKGWEAKPIEERDRIKASIINAQRETPLLSHQEQMAATLVKIERSLNTIKYFMILSVTLSIITALLAISI